MCTVYIYTRRVLTAYGAIVSIFTAYIYIYIYTNIHYTTVVRQLTHPFRRGRVEFKSTYPRWARHMAQGSLDIIINRLDILAIRLDLRLLSFAADIAGNQTASTHFYVSSVGKFLYHQSYIIVDSPTIWYPSAARTNISEF